MSEVGLEDSHQFLVWVSFVVLIELEGCQSKWLLSHALSVPETRVAREEGTPWVAGKAWPGSESCVDIGKVRL